MLRKLVLFVAVSFATFGSYIHCLSQRPHDKKLNIVFDLDKTLIKAQQVDEDGQTDYEYVSCKPDVVFYDTNPHDLDPNDPNVDQKLLHETVKYLSYERPGVHFVLSFLKLFNNLYMFTHATEWYTNQVIEGHNFNSYFQRVIAREENDKLTGDPEQLSKNLDYITNNPKRILISDKTYDQHEDQSFYHIRAYSPAYKYADLSMFTLCTDMIKENLKHDFQTFKSYLFNIFNK